MTRERKHLCSSLQPNWKNSLKPDPSPAPQPGKTRSPHWTPGIVSTEDPRHLSTKDCCQKSAASIRMLPYSRVPQPVRCQHHHYSIPQRALSVSSVRPPLTAALPCCSCCRRSLGRWLLELHRVPWCISTFVHQTKDKSILLGVFMRSFMDLPPLSFNLGLWWYHLIITMIVCFQVMLLFKPDKF